MLNRLVFFLVQDKCIYTTNKKQRSSPLPLLNSLAYLYKRVIEISEILLNKFDSTRRDEDKDGENKKERTIMDERMIQIPKIRRSRWKHFWRNRCHVTYNNFGVIHLNPYSAFDPQNRVIWNVVEMYVVTFITIFIV